MVSGRRWRHKLPRSRTQRLRQLLLRHQQKRNLHHHRRLVRPGRFKFVQACACSYRMEQVSLARYRGRSDRMGHSTSDWFLNVASPAVRDSSPETRRAMRKVLRSEVRRLTLKESLPDAWNRSTAAGAPSIISYAYLANDVAISLY